MKKKIIIFDGQLFQTQAWHRGMGRYVIQMMKHMSEQFNVSDTKAYIIFNNRIETEAIRFETIEYVAPNFQHIHVDLPLPNKKQTNEDEYVKALDKAIATSISADNDNESISYTITSPYSFDFFAQYPTNAKNKSMIFYDLTPLLQWKDLGGYFPPHMYMHRFRQVYESDQIFAISETTRRDCIDIFGLDNKKVININGGFTEHPEKPKEPAHFTVPKKYILFPTGDLPHKNNDIVMRAFKQVAKHHTDISLLVTSEFLPSSKDRLMKLAGDRVIFTGNVSNEELDYLNRNATIVLFASKYEGLGLPILDAVHYGKAVVASDIPVFREMSEHAFQLFKYDDVDSAIHAIESAITTTKSVNERAYLSIKSKYTWNRVAQDFLEALNFDTTYLVNDYPLRNIAILSSNPGIKDTIARILEPLHGHMITDNVRVDYFFDSQGAHHSGLERPTFLDYVGPLVYDLREFSRRKYNKYDAVYFLVDDKSLSHKLAMYITAIPGYIIKDTSISSNDKLYRAARWQALDEVTISNDNALGELRSYLIKTPTDLGKDRRMTVPLPRFLQKIQMKRMARQYE